MMQPRNDIERLLLELSPEELEKLLAQKKGSLTSTPEHEVTIEPYRPARVEAYRQYQTQQRLYRDWQHQQQNDGFARFCWGLGIVCTGFVVVMMFGSIFAQATRPTPPPAPIVNPDCWMFCGS